MHGYERIGKITLNKFKKKYNEKRQKNEKEPNS